MTRFHKSFFFAPALALALIAFGCVLSLPTPSRLARSTSDGAPTASAGASYGKLPLSFEANRGQTDDRVHFVSRGAGYALFLTATEAVLQLCNVDSAVPGNNASLSSTKLANEESANRSSKPNGRPSAVLRMKLAGSNPNPHAIGLEELPGTANYFIGNDPKRWRTRIPTYERIKYQAVYPGIDLLYYGNNQRQLEYDFIVAPGADPGRIALDFDGAEKVELKNGEVRLSFPGGEVRLQKPLIYQEIDNSRLAVSGGYTLGVDHRVGFEVGPYDPNSPLVIDPVLGYSTYLGGAGNDAGLGIAVNAHGDAFVTGVTLSLNFPTVPPDSKIGPGGGFDAFVSKLNASGSALLYSCYLGGSSDEDLYGGITYGGIAVDLHGNAYATGVTLSNDFPTKNSFPPPLPGKGQGNTFNGGVGDAFVTKLDSTGALVYSSYIGGTGFDGAFSIAVDQIGQAYVTGLAGPGTFPVTFNAFQPVFGGGSIAQDGFVTVLNRTGDSLVYSTYLGGSSNELTTGIAVNFPGTFYVVGSGGSTDLPVSANALQPTLNGLVDIFVAKGNTAGAIEALTYLGGSSNTDLERTIGHGIAVDSKGNVYVTGITDSNNFPTSNCVQCNLTGLADAFVAKLNNQLSTLVYSTYLGGDSTDLGRAVAVDFNGNAYVTGFGTSGFPTTPAASDCENTDAFVVKLNPAGSFVYSLCLGGSGEDVAADIAVDASGCAFVIGRTESTDFPTVNPLQPDFAGPSNDAFVAKLCDGLDHFKCYDVKPASNFQPFEVTLHDQFETQVVTVVKPLMLCNPVAKCVDGDCTQVLNPEDHLVCYETKDSRGTSIFERREVIISNQFGQQQRLTVYKRANLLCVPSQKAHADQSR